MQEPWLRIALDLSDAVPLLQLAGELDHWSSHELNQELASISGAGFAGVTLDLAGLQFMGCGGHRAVTAARESGLQVELRNVPCQVQQLLDVTCVPPVEESPPTPAVVRPLQLTRPAEARSLVIRQLPARGTRRQFAAG